MRLAITTLVLFLLFLSPNVFAEKEILCGQMVKKSKSVPAGSSVDGINFALALGFAPLTCPTGDKNYLIFPFAEDAVIAYEVNDVSMNKDSLCGHEVLIAPIDKGMTTEHVENSVATMGLDLQSCNENGTDYLVVQFLNGSRVAFHVKQD